MTQENTDVAQLCSVSVRKANLELNLVTDMKSDKKCFYRYKRSKKNTKENVSWLLNGVGDPVAKNTGKAEMLKPFLTFDFTGKSLGFIPGRGLVVGEGATGMVPIKIFKKLLQLQIRPLLSKAKPICTSAVTYLRGKNLWDKLICSGSSFGLERSRTQERQPRRH